VTKKEKKLKQNNHSKPQTIRKREEHTPRAKIIGTERRPQPPRQRPKTCQRCKTSTENPGKKKARTKNPSAPTTGEKKKKKSQKGFKPRIKKEEEKQEKS